MFEAPWLGPLGLPPAGPITRPIGLLLCGWFWYFFWSRSWKYYWSFYYGLPRSGRVDL